MRDNATGAAKAKDDPQRHAARANEGAKAISRPPAPKIPCANPVAKAEIHPHTGGGGHQVPDSQQSGAPSHETPAAIAITTPTDMSPQDSDGGHGGDDIHPTLAPVAQNSSANVDPQAADAARSKGEGQHERDSQWDGALPHETPGAIIGPIPSETALPAGETEAQCGRDSQVLADLRFADPTVQAVVEIWRVRQDMVRAQQAQTLRAKAICRRFTRGDKEEADKLFTAVVKGTDHPLADHAVMAIYAILHARAPLEEQRAAYEKTLVKLARDLPCAGFCDGVKGFGLMALAKVVGECGDLTAYHKGISGIWKRAGLAVIEGERQRRKTGEAALLHGYSPERRSVFWNIADPLLKAQGKGENAGPYRRFYDQEKERFLSAGLTKGHAHNRAMRHMTKLLLEDLHRYWCEVNAGGQGTDDSQLTGAPGSHPQAINASQSISAAPADGTNQKEVA
jgi:hypothetical protein